MTTREKTMIYAGLIGALIDHIESDNHKSFLNDNFIKYQSQRLLDELLKKEKKIFKADPNDAVLEQYVQAGNLMVKFYLIGLQMVALNKDKCQLLEVDLNILLKRYGIDLQF